jgi:tryptophan synthase alpha chain
MSRITTQFEGLQARGQKALACFITAGDGGVETTLATMHAMVEAGASIVELGVPFSDPMADGPVIQKASERSLACGTRVDDVLATVAKFRETDNITPVVLMGYLNPMEARGVDKFAAQSAAAGVDGIITVDLPPEDAIDETAAFTANGLAPIFLVAPTSSPERIRAICANAAGFVYFVSVKGVTGTRTAVASEVGEKIAEIRAATSVPVGVGFGIRDAESARAMAPECDAIIVGTALVEQFAVHEHDVAKIPAAVASLVSDLRAGIDSAS